jgi:hypothetical protein
MKSYANPCKYPQRFTQDPKTGGKRPAYLKENNVEYLAFDQDGNSLKIPPKYKAVYAVNHVSKFIPENRSILLRITVNGTALEYYYVIEGPIKRRGCSLFYYVGAVMNNSPWYDKLKNEIIHEIKSHYGKSLINAHELRERNEFFQKKSD